MLSDGETEREVYHSVLNAGEQEIAMNLDSMKPGQQTLRTYIGDELADERIVTFGDE